MKGIYLTYNSPVKTGEALCIKLRINNKYGFISEVKAFFNLYGQEPGKEDIVDLSYDKALSDNEYSTFKATKFFDAPNYHTFHIAVKLNGIWQNIKYSGEDDSAILESEAEGKNLEFWKCFSYLKTFKTPDWVKGGIMYQIFVDTFCCKDPPESVKDKLVAWNTFPKWMPDSDGVYRNDQYYGGNIKGIISKIPYIKSLGVTAIYLTPIFKGGSSNRYDTIDYEEIDEIVGTWDDQAELKSKANAIGIKVIQDVVFNHASSENPLIKTFPELFTAGRWWGYKNLVEFNKANPGYFELLERWIEKYSKYFDGIRLDVADELPDEVLRFIRSIAKKYDFYILGEVWKNAVTGDHRGFLYGNELDGVMNYQFTNAIYRFVRWKNFNYFRGVVNDIKTLYPPEALDVSPIFLSSHDIPRIPNILVGDFMKEDPSFENVWSMENDGFWFVCGIFDTFKFRKWEVENDRIVGKKLLLAKKMQKVAVFLQYTLPGLPAIFAGDEIGIMGYKDPMNRKPMTWDYIDHDVLNFYIKIGQFRASHREIFADSTNFTLPEMVKEQEIWQYRRGEINCIVDLKKFECMAQISGKTVFYAA